MFYTIFRHPGASLTAHHRSAFRLVDPGATHSDATGGELASHAPGRGGSAVAGGALWCSYRTPGMAAVQGRTRQAGGAHRPRRPPSAASGAHRAGLSAEAARCADAGAGPQNPATWKRCCSDYTLLYKAELDYLHTPAAQADFSFRANIERHIAGLTQHNGARHANSVGLTNVNFQLNMAATASNLKHWLVLTLQQERQGYKQRPPCPTSLYPPP